jgi:hypothetical protein
MGEIHNFLPRLTVNQLLIRDLMAAQAPCLRVGNDYFIKQPDGRLLVRIRSCGFSPLESLQV